MHMGLQDKLQHYAAPDDAHVVGIDGPLTADAIVDAHLQALAAGRSLVLVHTGAPTPVALRTAARFRATLVDAATLPEPPAPEPVAALPAREEAPPALLAAHEPTLALPAHEEPPAAPPARVAPPQPFPLPQPGFFRALERVYEEPAFGAVGAPLFDMPVLPKPLVEIGVLPWDPATQAPEPAAAAAVDEEEFESMPWNVVHHELLPAGRNTRPHHAAVRPTTAPDWGLPWPRPVVPTDGLAVADPRLWKTQERIGAIREDLTRAGAPSFGLAKPEGSAWLKRLHEFGSP